MLQLGQGCLGVWCGTRPHARNGPEEIHGGGSCLRHGGTDTLKLFADIYPRRGLELLHTQGNTGRRGHTLIGHSARLLGLAFRPDGLQLATAAADRTIRLSDRLREMPTWVSDYVLVHELAHLIEANHSTYFWELVGRYPKTERARGFLEGFAAVAGAQFTED